MAPVAENGFDSQIRADLANGFKRIGVQRIDHGHGQYFAQLVDGQQAVFEADRLRDQAQQFLADLIVGQADVGDFALFDQKRNEFVLLDILQIHKDLPDKTAFFLLALQRLIQFVASDDPFADEHFSKQTTIVGTRRLRRIPFGVFAVLRRFILLRVFGRNWA